MEGVVHLDCIQACCEQQATFVSVLQEIQCYNTCYEQAGWKYVPPEVHRIEPIPLICACLLLTLSALFSGLNLGLMSLDKTGLQIIMESGTGKEPEYAATIYPVRKRGNLLLTTLLLGNTLVNSCIAILMASVTSGVLGLVVSTLAIVILGEIIPQALCSRHGLYIGAHTVGIVKFFIVLMFPLSYPISLALDKALGADLGTVYTRDELLKLIEIHVQNPAAQQESGLTHDDHALITGALDYKKKRVKDVMTEMSKIFMLEVSERLNFQTLYNIYKSGFTRIPVYENYPQNMVGLLYAKDLILVDPDDEIEVRTILSFHGRDIRSIPEDTCLDTVFQEFKSSYIHLFFSTRSKKDVEEKEPEPGPPNSAQLDKVATGTPKSPYRPASRSMAHPSNVEADYVITGIITLEDVIEEMIQDEIVDETDNYVDMNEPGKRIKRNRKENDIAGFLKILEHKRLMRDVLTSQEIQAIATFLGVNVAEFKPLGAAEEGIMKGLVRHAKLVETYDNEHNDDSGRGARQGTTIYEKGQPADYFTLVISGWLTITAGAEGFESEMGPWSCIANRALGPDVYIPDFSAIAYGACRLLQIFRSDYAAAVYAAKLDYITVSGHTLKHATSDASTKAGSAHTAAPASSGTSITAASVAAASSAAVASASKSAAAAAAAASAAARRLEDSPVIGILKQATQKVTSKVAGLTAELGEGGEGGREGHDMPGAGDDAGATTSLMGGTAVGGSSMEVDAGEGEGALAASGHSLKEGFLRFTSRALKHVGKGSRSSVGETQRSYVLLGETGSGDQGGSSFEPDRL